MVTGEGLVRNEYYERYACPEVGPPPLPLEWAKEHRKTSGVVAIFHEPVIACVITRRLAAPPASHRDTLAVDWMQMCWHHSGRAMCNMLTCHTYDAIQMCVYKLR